MNPKLRELYDQERALIQQANALLDKPDATEDEINAKQAEIDTLRAKIKLAEAAEAAGNDDPPKGAPLPNGNNEKPVYNGAFFYRAVIGRLSSDESAVLKQIMRDHRAQLTENKAEDGGYVVPEDLTKEIIEAIKREESVRNLVRVEDVKTKSGRRIVRTGTPNKLFNTDEREEIKKLNNPQYDVIPYDIHKYAGLMDVPNELFDDAFVNFINEIRTWLADAARETENEKILYGGGGINPMGLLDKTEPYYIEHTAPAVIDIKALRRIKNKLKQGYRANARWVMNTEAFELISNIEDKNGRGILAEDPRKPDAFTLFGLPVEIYDSIKTDEDHKTDILFGDFKRGYRMFDRKSFEFKLTDTGAGAFETDTVKARGIERFDGQRMDKEAIVVVRGVVVGTDA